MSPTHEQDCTQQRQDVHDADVQKALINRTPEDSHRGEITCQAPEEEASREGSSI